MGILYSTNKQFKPRIFYLNPFLEAIHHLWYDEMLGAEYMLPLFLKEYILPFWGVMHHQSSPNPTHVHFHKTCDEILISVEQLEHLLLSGFPCGSQSCWCYRIPGLKQTNSKCMVWPTHVPTTVFVCKTDKPALFSSLLWNVITPPPLTPGEPSQQGSKSVYNTETILLPKIFFYLLFQV